MGLEGRAWHLTVACTHQHNGCTTACSCLALFSVVMHLAHTCSFVPNLLEVYLYLHLTKQHAKNPRWPYAILDQDTPAAGLVQFRNKTFDSVGENLSHAPGRPASGCQRPPGAVRDDRIGMQTPGQHRGMRPWLCGMANPVLPVCEGTL